MREHLESEKSETPKPGDEIFKNCITHLAARPVDMVDQVAEKASQMGFNIVNLGADIEGEARDIGEEHARLALEYKAKMTKADQPIAIISGGETSVTISGKSGSYGRGGRNCEYILSLAIKLDGAHGIYALACDSDGIDGSEDNAGALIYPDTLSRAKQVGCAALDFLEGHDSYSLFEKTKDLYITGPTLTNVNDLRIILLMPPE